MIEFLYWPSNLFDTAVIALLFLLVSCVSMFFDLRKLKAEAINAILEMEQRPPVLDSFFLLAFDSSPQLNTFSLNVRRTIADLANIESSKVYPEDRIWIDFAKLPFWNNTDAVEFALRLNEYEEVDFSKSSRFMREFHSLPSDTSVLDFVNWLSECQEDMNAESAGESMPGSNPKFTGTKRGSEVS